MNPDDDPPPLDAASAMRLIREQRAATAHSLEPDPRLHYWPWGVAWLVGFGLFFLRFSPDGRTFVTMPEWLPLTALFVLLGAASVVFTVGSARAYRQVTGESARRGGWYGAAWGLGFVSLFTVAGRVSDSLPHDLAGLLWSALAVGLTGALHMAGGAIWLDRTLFRLGLWLTTINIVGVLAGPGWHALVVALAGGGGMLVAGELARLRRRNLP
ncbi:transporter [Micromonospora sp. RTP1Z1]|uniref:transporter n=1 Tax=Micromonospora sp. RTP1Z1 TaxID=2994043 RepID=UPI0029C85820|nr:transporter [Micromonospora sp. RTP1Z1]